MIALETLVLTLINRVAVLLYLENEIVPKREVTMKSSRLYENLIILLIIMLFCCVVVANDTDFIEETKSFQKPHKVESLISIQIDHPELRIGPMEGCCVIIYSIHSKFQNKRRSKKT